MKGLLCAFVLLVSGAAPAGAAVPPHPHLDVTPPGRVMQRTVAYLTGEAMHSAWYVIASRTLAGRNMGKTPVYQWYLSFYAPDGNDGGKLVYRLPGKHGTLLSRISKAHDAQMYFPQQNLEIVGAAELERSGVQDVVVWDHQAGADCGAAGVTVFGATPGGTVEQRVHVENGCDLHARIVRHGELSAVRLKGPYYGPNAPLCCPTKPHANALLAFKNGKWRMTPNYFTLTASPAQQTRRLR